MPTRQELLGVLETLDKDGLSAALAKADDLNDYTQEQLRYAVWCKSLLKEKIRPDRSFITLVSGSFLAIASDVDGAVTADFLDAERDSWYAYQRHTSHSWTPAQGREWAVNMKRRGAIKRRSVRNAQAAKLCETIEVSLCRQDKNSCTYSPP